MRNSHTTALHKRQSKDTKNILKLIRKTVEKNTGLTTSQLKKRYSEEDVFYKALQYVTTTKKAVCKALDLEVENACRYKRKLEEQGLLVQSADEVICPFSGRMAHKLTTNEKMFSELSKSNTNQLKMF